MSERPEQKGGGERRRDPLRRFWTRDAMRELAESGELGEPSGTRADAEPERDAATETTPPSPA